MIYILTAHVLHQVNHLSSRGLSSHSSPLQIHDLKSSACYFFTVTAGRVSLQLLLLVNMTFSFFVKSNTAYRISNLRGVFLYLPLQLFVIYFFQYIFMNVIGLQRKFAERNSQYIVRRSGHVHSSLKVSYSRSTFCFG